MIQASSQTPSEQDKNRAPGAMPGQQTDVQKKAEADKLAAEKANQKT
jgi:hypothetical protein